MKHLERNIKLYYLYSATWVMMIGPILVVYLLDKGLNFSQIMMLQTVGAVATVLTEVPSGAIADLYGRKTTLCLSSISLVIAMILFVIAPNYGLLMVGEIFAGIGLSFKSGSDSSLVYDTLLELDRESDYLHVQSRGHAYFLGTQILGSILAGILYKMNVTFPFYASALLIAFSALVATRLIEVNAFKNKEKPPYLKQIIDSGKFTFSHQKVRAILFVYVFFYFFYRVGFWFYQPYFQAVHIDVAYFGLLFAAFNIIATLSSRYADFFIQKTKGFSLIAIAFLIAISFILLGITPHYLGVAFIGLQQVARGVQQPVFLKYINKQIPSHQRATIISFNSLLGNLGSAMIYPIMGLLMDHMNIFYLHLLLGIIMLMGCFYFMGYLKKQFI